MTDERLKEMERIHGASARQLLLDYITHLEGENAWLEEVVRAADEMAAAVTSSETSGMEAWIYKMIAARDNYRKARNSTREGDGE